MENTTPSAKITDYNVFWENLDDFIKYNPGARFRRNWILNALKQMKPMTLLDAGCGNAELIVAIKKLFPKIDITGGDVSTSIIAKNRNLFPNIKFETLDLQKESLNQQYDCVICSEVIEHLEKQELAFSNLVKMLKPGGFLILTCPTGKIFKTEKYFGHIRHPSLKDFEDFANKYNISFEKHEQWGWPFYYFTKVATNINSNWALQEFGSGNYNFTKKMISHFLYGINKMNLPSSPLGVQLNLIFRRP